MQRWARTLVQEVLTRGVVQGKFVPFVTGAQTCEFVDSWAGEIKSAYELLQQRLRDPV